MACTAIITCAVTGGAHTPSMPDALPVTPDEIAEQGVAAVEAGAAILHLHARQPHDGMPKGDPAVYSQLEPDNVSSACGIGREATMWLLERGVRVTGTDAWIWDAPFVHTGKRCAETGNAGLIWEGHKAGRTSATATSKSSITSKARLPAGSPFPASP